MVFMIIVKSYIKFYCKDITSLLLHFVFISDLDCFEFSQRNSVRTIILYFSFLLSSSLPSFLLVLLLNNFLQVKPSQISAAFMAAADSSGRSDRRQFRSGQLAGARNFGERAESFALMFSP